MDLSFLSLLFRYIFVVSSIGGEVGIFERGSENDLIKRQVRISDYNNARQKSKL